MNSNTEKKTWDKPMLEVISKDVVKDGGIPTAPESVVTSGYSTGSYGS